MAAGIADEACVVDDGEANKTIGYQWAISPRHVDVVDTIKVILLGLCHGLNRDYKDVPLTNPRVVFGPRGEYTTLSISFDRPVA